MAEPSPYSAHHDPVHSWFGLTYANYLVLNRSLMQSMPDEWQHRMVQCLWEMFEAFDGLPFPSGYRVSAVDVHGRFTKDLIPHYNRGRTRVERADG